MIERTTRAAVARRRTVLCCWLVLAALGVLASRSLDSRLSTSLAVPGTASQRAAAILTAHFGDDDEGSFIVVVPDHLPAARSSGGLSRKLALAARALPGATVTPVARGPGFDYAGIDTPLGLQAATADTPALRAALEREGLGRAELTGAPALQHDLTPVLAADLRRGEVVALAVALVLLLATLGASPAVLVPFAVALCSIATVLGLLDLLARVTLLVLYVPNLVELIGLGLAIDYSLLVVRRFTEELASGRGVEEAVQVTMATAGRTVVASATAVAVGLCVLLAIPVPFVRSLGLAGLLVPLASLLAAATLLPALLATLGRAALPRRRRTGTEPSRPAPWPSTSRGDRLVDGGPEPAERGLWLRLPAFVARHRVGVLAASLALIGAAASPLAWLQLTPVSLSAIPHDSPAERGLETLSERIGPGAISPIEVVLDSGRAGGAREPGAAQATLRLARSVLRQPGVLAVAIGSRPPYLDRSGRYEEVIVVPRDDLGAPSTRRLVAALRQRLLPAAAFPAGTTGDVGGAPAQGVDFLARVYGAFPWVVLAIVVLTWLVLVGAFRSLLLPTMAILLDACSVAAAYGLLVVVFRFGVGADLLGLYRVPQIEGWVPVFCFAVLFGLSMDYEVFLVSRMREAILRGASNDEAVAAGMAATGRIVTVAALVMVGALCGLVAGHVAGLQELGVGLALGVLIDATVVRSLLLPSLMGLCGSANWWLPARSRRVR